MREAVDEVQAAAAPAAYGNNAADDSDNNNNQVVFFSRSSAARSPSFSPLFWMGTYRTFVLRFFCPV